jgi:threonine/homoserine/homoserine lactone efflux protein
MTEAIISGILLGGVLAFLVGPVFFMLVHTSVHKGFVSAMMLSIGVVSSDAVFAGLTYLGSSSISGLQEMNSLIGIAGGVLVVLFGVFNLLKPPSVNAKQLNYKNSTKGSLIEMAKGFSMNSLNPSVLLFWLGVAGTWSIQDPHGHHAEVFYGSALSTVFITDLAKAWGATHLKKIASAGFLIWMNRVSGILLLLFGLAMIVKFLGQH